MAKRKEEEPPKGAPAWQSTFADLMNLLLCFFVLLFSMSKIEEDKWMAVVASFQSSTMSVFDGGAEAIGDGVLISNGVSQLNELSQYINSSGQAEEVDEPDDTLYNEMEREGLAESEQMAEQIEEALAELNLDKEIDVDFNSQYVLLTMKGAILFDSGRAELKPEIYPALDRLGWILMAYADSLIEIEGHTDNVPIHNAAFANNDELSSARALAVFHYFMETTTLDPVKLKHSGRGEYIPVADNGTEEGRARNRRVEIKIYNTLSTER